MAKRKDPAALKPAWPDGLQMRQSYEVKCDDDGRMCDSNLRVYVADDGDVHVSMSSHYPDEPSNYNPFPSIRIRTIVGGGRMSRTRQALLWLAKAIELDQQDLAERYGIKQETAAQPSASEGK